MEILWLAIVFYSIGLGLVLHFRPALMFNENGTWKEFGYQRSANGSRDRHTMFPFWLFAVSWAFVSYAIAASITWVIPAVGIAATASASALASNSQDDYADSDFEETIVDVEKVDDTLPTIRRGRGRPRKTPRPGYYVIDPESQESGLRKYIYYGSQPPPDEA
jgi:hypothetical protein